MQSFFSKAWGNFDGNFFVILCVVVLSIMCILPYCWFASILSLKLLNISDDAFNSLWYTHPTHLQKYVRWIIIYGQIPRNFDGYHIFKCSLEVFMKVIEMLFISNDKKLITQFILDCQSIWIILFNAKKFLERSN